MIMSFSLSISVLSQTALASQGNPGPPVSPYFPPNYNWEPPNSAGSYVVPSNFYYPPAGGAISTLCSSTNKVLVPNHSAFLRTGSGTDLTQTGPYEYQTSAGGVSMEIWASVYICPGQTTSTESISNVTFQVTDNGIVRSSGTIPNASDTDIGGNGGTWVKAVGAYAGTWGSPSSGPVTHNICYTISGSISESPGTFSNLGFCQTVTQLKKTSVTPSGNQLKVGLEYVNPNSSLHGPSLGAGGNNYININNQGSCSSSGPVQGTNNPHTFTLPSGCTTQLSVPYWTLDSSTWMPLLYYLKCPGIYSSIVAPSDSINCIRKDFDVSAWPNHVYGCCNVYSDPKFPGVDTGVRVDPGWSWYFYYGFYDTSAPENISCSANPSSANPGQNVTFTASGGSGPYDWSGGGSPATGSGATFTSSFSTTGTKTVRATSGRSIASCEVNISTPPPPAAELPYFRVYGGDAAAGIGFGSSCTPSPSAGIRAFTNGANNGGAGAQLAALAAGAIDRFISAQRSSSPSPPKGLSLSNTNGTYGGNLGTTSCVPDYFSLKAGATDIDLSSGTLTGTDLSQNPNPGKYRSYLYTQSSASSALVITQNSAQRVTGRHVVYVDGNAVITTNLAYQDGSWDTDTSPSLWLIVKGNIYIKSGVTSIEGVFIAQPEDDGSGGKIYTCTNAAGNGPPTTASDWSSCGY